MSEPTAKELLEAQTSAADAILAFRVEKVLALHCIGDVGLPPSAKPRCGSCREHWPCPTVRLLNGEKL